MLASCNLSDTIATSAHASKMGGSQVYLQEGGLYTRRDDEGRDYCQRMIVVAQHISATVEGFLDLMNERAKG